MQMTHNSSSVEFNKMPKIEKYIMMLFRSPKHQSQNDSFLSQTSFDIIICSTNITTVCQIRCWNWSYNGEQDRHMLFTEPRGTKESADFFFF